MAYGKIDKDNNNYLMTSVKQINSTWIRLADFVKKADGSLYTYYVDKYTPDLKQEASLMVGVLTEEISLHIQKEVDKYNELNGLRFGDIHNVANYINTPTYSHHSWCVSVWNWNVLVWEKGREIQTQVANGARPMPTWDEVVEELPKFIF